MKAFFRSSKNLGKVYYSQSKENDYKNWETPVPTNLENPNSGLDTIFFEGSLYLVSNPSQTNRCPLVIQKIEQDKKDPYYFKIIETLEIKDKVSENSPFISKELSYPYIVEDNGLFHLVYTYGRQKIEYVVIRP